MCFIRVGEFLKKAKNKKKRIIIGVTVSLVLLVVVAAALLMPFVVSFYKNAYTESEIVERTDVYVRPEMDEQPSGWEDITLSEEEMEYDITESEEYLPESLPENVNPGGLNGNYNGSNSFGNSETQ